MHISIRTVALAAGAATLAAASVAFAFDDPPPPTSILGADRSHAREIFATKCASCHEKPTSDRIPTREAISAGGPDNLVRALTEGPMKPMAAGLTPAEIDSLALCVWAGVLTYELVRIQLDVIGYAPFSPSAVLLTAALAAAFSPELTGRPPRRPPPPKDLPPASVLRMEEYRARMAKKAGPAFRHPDRPS